MLNGREWAEGMMPVSRSSEGSRRSRRKYIYIYIFFFRRGGCTVGGGGRFVWVEEGGAGRGRGGWSKMWAYRL